MKNDQWTAKAVAAYDSGQTLQHKLEEEGVKLSSADRAKAEQLLDGIREPLDREALVEQIHQAATDRIASNTIEDKQVALAILRQMPKGPTEQQRKAAEDEAAMARMDEEGRHAPPDPPSEPRGKTLPYIRFEQIDLGEDTCTRVKLNEDAIVRYGEWYEAYSKGEGPRGQMPEPVLFTEDDKRFYVGDGRHRVAAQMRKGLKGCLCEVRRGDKWDAIAFAAQNDLNTAVPKTKDDRGRTVDLMLLDPVRKEWTDGEIARHCGVSDVTVGKHRKKFEKAGKVEPTPIRKRKGGKPLNTKNIGKGKGKKPEPPPPPPPPAGSTTSPPPPPPPPAGPTTSPPKPSITPNPSESPLTWTRRMKEGDFEPFPQGIVKVQVKAIYDDAVTLVFQS